MVQVGPLPGWLLIKVILNVLGLQLHVQVEFHCCWFVRGNGSLEDRLQFWGERGCRPFMAGHGRNRLVQESVWQHLSLLQKVFALFREQILWYNYDLRFLHHF